MPVVGTNAPYDTADTVLNLARSILNDAGGGLSGNLLADTQPYTFTYLNSAYRYLQEALIDAGVETFAKEFFLLNITPCTVNDPSVQIYVDFDNYFDGTNLNGSPVLPPDMVLPLRLWERASGMTTSPFRPMRPVNDGLPTDAQSALLRYWDWKTDKLYFNGALQSNDVRLRYIAYLPDLINGTDLVRIFRSLNTMAFITAAEFAAARGSPAAGDLRGQAEEFLEQMTSRTARRKQRGSHRRRPYGRHRSISSGMY